MTGVDLHHHGDVEATAGLLDFAVNVFALPRPRWLDEALRDSLHSIDAYPDSRPAREAIARRHGCDAAQVLPTAGAAEAFTLIARWRRWRCPVVVHPQFTEPHAALTAAGLWPVVAHLEAPFRLESLVLPDDADLVVVGNPTNPTGVHHRAAQIAELRAPGRVVVIDEAFIDTVPGERESVAGMPDVVVLRSLTKQWSIPGIRAGYLLGPAAWVAELAALQPPWSVSTPAIAAMIATATPPARTESERRANAVAQWRSHLESGLERLGVDFVPSSTSFVLARPGDGVHAALRTRGVAVRRADTFPGLDGSWVRIAVREPPMTQLLLDALGSVLHARGSR